MHTDLSPHLHSVECNKIISSLKECHQLHKVGKFLGYCNELNRELNNCLKREREEKRKNNYRIAKEREAVRSNSQLQN